MIAVSATGLGKEYRRYPRPLDRVLEWAGRGVRHEAFWAVRDVSFEVERGGALGIVGDNGAGKTTLLAMLAGATEPTRGTLSVAGRASSILELGAGFHGEFSGRENIFLAGAAQGMGRSEVARRAQQIIDFSELGEFIDLPVRTYSSGMFLRLAFSIATASEPEVLVIDEALAVGDQRFQAKCADRIVQFLQRGGTLIFCSHNLYQVKKLCRHAVWLDHGRVAAEGPAARVCDAYADRSRALRVTGVLELGAREAKFATLTALSNDRYWEQDAELRFVRVKPAGREHDWVDANHVGRRRWELPGVDASDPIWNAHRATLERHEPFRDFVYARNADGAQRWTTVSGEPVFAADGAFRGYRGIARDLTPDKRAEQRVHELAHYDGLTGLLNRTIFRDELAASISHARRNDRRVAILFVDLDGFKQVNDMHGHAVGDRVLQETAKRLRSAVRATERIARLGGDEFVVLVEEDAPGAGLAAARRLVRALALPQEINNHEIHLSASIGVALYPDDSRDLDELLQQADLAMYRVKAAGGNAVGSFSRDLQIRARERVSIANDLRHALESGQFRVFWQPVVAATDGRVLAAEALLRWEHPLRGLVMPGTFIPIAEETGLIVPIGRWAMNVAFAQARAWAALRYLAMTEGAP